MMFSLTSLRCFTIAAEELNFTRAAIMLPPLLSAFHQMFPQIQLHLLEAVDSSCIRQTFQISVCRLRHKVLTRTGREFTLLAKEIYGDVPTGRIPPQSHSGSDR